MKNERSSRRSEKVRRRLKQESKTWINQASQRLTEPERSILMEDKVLGSPASSKGAQANKQNHFFRIGWRLISLILAVGFAYGIYTFWNAPEYRVANITINGLQRISEDDLMAELDLLGDRIYTIDKNAIKTNLKRSYPELWDISISLIMPNKIAIDLVERQPMIAWKFDDLEMWIDAEGYLIPARQNDLDLLTIKADALPTYYLAQEHILGRDQMDADTIQNILIDKPSAKGDFQQSLFFAFPKQVTPDLLTAILQLNAWMPEEQELLYEEIRGVGWKDARGWNVFIGSKLEKINDKMLMYETIIRQLDKEGIKPAMVSVEFLHAPYYRLEN